jgi:CubicO group peptidase (beta-lactamase class C family)
MFKYFTFKNFSIFFLLTVVAPTLSALSAPQTENTAKKIAAVSKIDEQKVKKLLPELKKYVDKSREEWGAPGVSVAIIEGDNVYHINSGLANIENKTEITKDSIFCIMSHTKTMTSAVLHQLVDEGKISLDDNVTKYLPWFKLKDENATKKIKVRHLVSHCIGFPEFWGDHFWHLKFSKQEIIDRISVVDLKYNVGEKYGYQNIFVGIAGILIEEVLKKPLSEIFNDYLFNKLEMDHSSMGEHPAGLSGAWGKIKSYFNAAEKRHDPSLIVSGYLLRNGSAFEIKSNEPYLLNGMSGVNSTTVDCAKFVSCLVNQGVINFGKNKGKRLFSKKAWESMSLKKIGIEDVKDESSQLDRKSVV